MTTPEQIEAQASADHERRIEEAERRVIELGREIATIAQEIINKDTTHTLLFIKCGEMLMAVKKLNALTTSVESPPEKVDEWDGWNVWHSEGGLFCIEHGRDVWASHRGDDWALQDVSYSGGKWARSAFYEPVEGTERIRLLKTLPDDLVKAAKGVGRG